MTKFKLFIWLVVSSSVAMFLISGSALAATFNPSYIMKDSVFVNSNSMNAAQINNFLNGFSRSCISPNSGFAAREPIGYTPPPGGFALGNFASAGKVIETSARVYGLDPRVLLVTLEKEQSLVTGRSSATYCYGTEHKYAAAMGYGCPDSGGSYSYTGVSLYRRNGVEHTSTGTTCVNTASKAGFSQQVIRAAWLLKYSQERSLGNVGWNVQVTNFPYAGNVWDNSDDPGFCYTGYMTPGNRARAQTGTAECTAVNLYDGRYTIDSTAVTMRTGATASLYRYTPHLHGNQNFFNLYVSWFGNPAIACTGTSNLSGIPSGPRIIDYNYGSSSRSYLTFTKMNNTGSTCTEAHVWEPGFTRWLTNVATGMDVTNPNSGRLIALKSSIDSKDSLTYIKYSGAGGRTEVHRLSPDLQILPGYYDVSTNLSGVSATSGTFVAGDFLGRGYDQLAYILYSGASGRAEVHMFDPSLRTAVGYYDIATDLAGVTATTGSFAAADFLGRGYDQLAYVTYGSTTVHLLDIRNGNATRIYEVPTNLQQTSAAAGTFVAGDFLGRGYGQLVYVIYSNSINRVETHMFNPSLTQATGFQDIITNLGGFDPDN